MEVTLLLVLRCEWKLSYIKRRMRSPAEKPKHKNRSGTSWKFGVPELRTGDFVCLSLFPGNLKGKNENKMTNDFIFYSRLVFSSCLCEDLPDLTPRVGLSCQSDI